MKRRHFIFSAAIAGLGVNNVFSNIHLNKYSGLKIKNKFPVTVATWNFQNATAEAGRMLDLGASSLDAVESGVRIEESNIKNTTVGIGGLPDRKGKVTLDASIMAPSGNAGSVVYLQEIEHPVSVARKVMEDTPHVMLAGEGALEFAINKGFKRKKLLTEESELAWKKWTEKKRYKPIINIENHDTIGMLCLDQKGDIAGACTTSGLAFKMNGRIGDSAIIGSGLFIDNEIGGAVATGLGEAIMKNVSSFLVVELMRNGMSPQQACEIALKRIVQNNPNFKDFQVGLLALNKAGEIGSYSIHSGFSYAKTRKGFSSNIQSEYYNK